MDAQKKSSRRRREVGSFASAWPLYRPISYLEFLSHFLTPKLASGIVTRAIKTAVEKYSGMIGELLGTLGEPELEEGAPDRLSDDGLVLEAVVEGGDEAAELVGHNVPVDCGSGVPVIWIGLAVLVCVK